MRRFVSEIRQYDYTSREEFLKDISRMREKGYILIDGIFQNALNPSEIVNGDKWKFTACYVKSKFM